MQVFYVNIGGGEPTVRPDFWELLDYAVDAPRRREVLHQRRRGSRPSVAARLAASDYVDVQISLDGATAEVNDARPRRRAPTPPRMRALEQPRRRPASRTPRSRWSCTRAERRPARRLQGASPTATAPQLRLTRLRPSGRGADVWDELHPTADAAARALRLAGRPRRGGAHRRLVLPPRRPSARRCPGLNLCGAGRVVCLIDPVGDVYACPFAIHDEFLAGNVLRRRRLRDGLARVRPVPRAARAADRRRVHEVLGTSTPAAAAAWRRSSSPACRWTAPTPSACRATASPRSPATARCRPPARTTRATTSATARRRSVPLDVGPPARPRTPATRTRSPASHSERPTQRIPMAERLVRDRRRGPAPGEEAPAEVGLLRAAGRLREGRHPTATTSTRSASSASPRTSPACSAERDLATTVMGQTISMPVIISPTGVQAVHPDGEVAVARAAAARGTAMGLSARSPASRSRRSSRPTRRRSSRSTGWAPASRWSPRLERATRGRRRRADRHPRLVVLARPRLGQPVDPREDRPQGACMQLRPRGRRCARAGSAELAPAPALPDLTVPNMRAARRAGARRSSAPTASGCTTPPPTWDDIAWLREQWGGPFMLKGIMPRRRRQARRRRRRHRDLGVEPRRQQPRRHPGADPRAARRRRGGRRPDRGRCSTAASAAAATSSRRSPSAPGR